MTGLKWAPPTHSSAPQDFADCQWTQCVQSWSHFRGPHWPQVSRLLLSLSSSQARTLVSPFSSRLNGGTELSVIANSHCPEHHIAHSTRVPPPATPFSGVSPVCCWFLSVSRALEWWIHPHWISSHWFFTAGPASLWSPWPGDFSPRRGHFLPHPEQLPLDPSFWRFGEIRERVKGNSRRHC